MTSAPAAPENEDAVLSPDQQSTFAELEAIVENGIKEHKKACAALKQIHDERLYRAEFRSFEAYCAARWNLSRSRAYELIGWVGVCEIVSAIADTAPANEAQARPLALLPHEEQAPAWLEAVATAPNGKMTANHVRNVVEERLAKNRSPSGGAPVQTPAERRTEETNGEQQENADNEAKGQDDAEAKAKEQEKAAGNAPAGQEREPNAGSDSDKQPHDSDEETGGQELTSHQRYRFQKDAEMSGKELASVSRRFKQMRVIAGDIPQLVTLGKFIADAQELLQGQVSAWRDRTTRYIEKEVSANQA